MQKVILGAIVSLFGFVNPVLAQSVIVPDGTLGNENSALPPVLQSPNLNIITNGAQRGQNLFHSFSQFNVGEGRSAYFFVPDVAIKNILTRITGNNRSEILGRLGTFQASGNAFAPSDANFFFMNPNGIIFGPSSSLDIGGSVLITTANAFQFPGGESFSASNPTIPSQVLTINPSALLYNAIVAQNSGIVVRSSFNNLNNLIGTTKGLQVRDGKSLLLSGGDISLEGGLLVAPSGRINLIGLKDSGTIKLDLDNSTLNLSQSDDSKLSNTSLIGKSIIFTTGKNGGSITISSKRVDISNSLIINGIDSQLVGDTKSGDIRINAYQDIRMNKAYIFNSLNKNSFGILGGIFIKSNSLLMNDGSTIKINIFGKGSSGKMSIRSTQDIALNSSSIVNFLDKDGSGNLGSMDVISDSNVFLNQSILGSQVFGDGNGGDVVIRAPSITVSNFSAITGFVGQSGNGRGSNINITSDNLFLSKRSGITSALSGSGKAGNIILTINDTLSLSEANLLTGVGSPESSTSSFNGNGSGGDIIIKAGYIKIEDSTLRTSNAGLGSAGNVLIHSNKDIQIKSSDIRSESILNGGNGGNITLMARDMDINESSILSGIVLGMGESGIISLDSTSSIQVYNNSSIFSSNTFGSGRAGSIFISTNSFKLFDNSSISASSFGLDNTSIFDNSTSGTVNIIAKSVLLNGESNNLRNTTGIFAVSSNVQGSSGSINISTDSLQVLNGATIDTSSSNSIAKSGNINIKAKRIEILNGGQISTTTSQIDDKLISREESGAIRLQSDSLIISGINSSLDKPFLEYQRNGTISGIPSGLFSRTIGYSLQKGGSIELDIGKLSISDGAVIISDSIGLGQAGSIDIKADSLSLYNKGLVSTRSEFTNGGNINLNIKGLILLRQNSQISSTAGTAQTGGDGGNININSGFIIAIPQENSDITANAFSGAGGKISITSPGIFGLKFRPKLTEFSDITASSTFGISGSVNLDAPDNSGIQNSLNQLPKSAIDTEKLVSQTCIVRQNQPTGTFYILGKTNLPQRPGDLIPSNYSTQESPTQTANRPWQKGDPIVEPQGFYKLANGRLVMSRECDR